MIISKSNYVSVRELAETLETTTQAIYALAERGGIKFNFCMPCGAKGFTKNYAKKIIKARQKYFASDWTKSKKKFVCLPEDE